MSNSIADINAAKVPTTKPENLQQMLESPQFVAKIQKALRGSMTTDIVGSLAMTQLRKMPKLAKADPITLFGAVITCSQNGWEIGRDVHLLPFENRRQGTVDVTVIPDYRGLIKLAIQSDLVSKVEAHVVYENDVFDFELGLQETLRHRPAMKNRGDFLCVYAVVSLADGNKQYEVMNYDDVMDIKKRSKSGNSGPWVTDFNMMARKTVIKRVLRYVGSSAELTSALDLDNKHEMGEQDHREWFGDDDFIEGEVVPNDKGSDRTEAPEKKAPAKRKPAAKKPKAAPKPEQDTQPPVVQGNEAPSDSDAAGTEPAGGDTQPAGGQGDMVDNSPVDSSADPITYAKVAQGVNMAPTEQDSQSWLNAARGSLPADQIAELVQLHLSRWKQDATDQS